MSTGHKYTVFVESDSEDFDGHCTTCGAEFDCDDGCDDDHNKEDDDFELLSETDATIKRFIAENVRRKKRIFLAVTADSCNPCKAIKHPDVLNWHTATEAGITSFDSRDAVAICFTVRFRREQFNSDTVGIKITGYPTILEYSIDDKHWKESNVPAISGRKWEPVGSGY